MAKKQEQDGSQGTTPSTVEPKIKFKDKIQTRMDRFKLQVANMKKNTSWRPKQPQIVEMEHTHFFLTCDEHGKPMIHSTPTGGHFHKVDWAVDQDGNLIAKCGPALKIDYIKMANGKQKKAVVPVEWKAQKETMDGVLDYKLQDTHTHECTYLFSHNVSAEMKKEIQRSNSEAIGPVQAKPQSVAATGLAPAGFSLEGSKID